MSLTRYLLLTAAIGCRMTISDDSRGDEKKPVADEAAIKAVIAYLGKNEVKLTADEHGWWVVTDPKGDGFQVRVHLRTFPVATTEKVMRDQLKQINLAYLLNVPSRVAMSHPSLRITNAEKKPPKLDQIPVVVKLEKLFKAYQPPDPKQ